MKITKAYWQDATGRVIELTPSSPAANYVANLLRRGEAYTAWDRSLGAPVIYSA